MSEIVENTEKPEDKLLPREGNTYSSWESIRKLSTRYILFLSYVASQKLPLSKARTLYKHIIFLNMLNLTKIRFSHEEQEIVDVKFLLNMC